MSSTLPVLVKDPQTQDDRYQTLSRFAPDSDLSRMVCVGGTYEATNGPGVNRHALRFTSVIYFPDDGEFLLSWDVLKINQPFLKSTHIDFFVVTAIIESAEIPISAYPFLGFTSYKMRTFSLIGAASRVKFRIYPVYHDFKIDIINSKTSDTYDIEDIRVTGNEVI